MTGDMVAELRSDIPLLDVKLHIPAGHTVAVLGPNGAGKSTLMNMLSGLLQPTSGSIRVGDRELVGPKTFVPPHKRGVAMLSQQGMLFPHLTVRQNVAFAPAAAHMPRTEVRSRTKRWLDAVNATDLADRKPAQLSGGQSQRVALARALAADPDLLLLDEPFSALDVDVVHRIRSMLRGILQDRARTTLLVTHDIADAVTLADSAIILGDGKIVAQGPVRELLASPVNQFAAQLAGLNLISGRWDGALLQTDRFAVAAMADEPIDDGATAMAAFSPRAVAVYRDPPAGSPRNVVKAVVAQIVPQGDLARVDCFAGDGVVTAAVTWAAVSELGLAADDEVYLVIKATEVTVYPAR
ncbi:sulfate/molybdate ABC transporter ATP-binding protein [Gordonia rubripertincta]|uniref:ABC transporter ATP-binding protein n=1 Tax=Gordonia rubripertincta TaxID=36822 RepID=A0ABT4MSG3_GORRU|nr:ABC transporter ATP-binding protein [Gordonia rubripertincta]MCZ4549957.1 ABC transporter ATP-binding protein [Gordonia rubripertincta]